MQWAIQPTAQSQIAPPPSLGLTATRCAAIACWMYVQKFPQQQQQQQHQLHLQQLCYKYQWFRPAPMTCVLLSTLELTQASQQCWRSMTRCSPRALNCATNWSWFATPSLWMVPALTLSVGLRISYLHAWNQICASMMKFAHLHNIKTDHVFLTNGEIFYTWI